MILKKYMRHYALAPFVLICLYFAGGCATAPFYNGVRADRRETAIIANVPFIRQKPDYCGPASLAMVFNFYGRDVTQDEIAGDIFSPELKGTLSIAMTVYAFQKGFDVEAYSGGVADLRAKIKTGAPVIVSHRENRLDTRVHYLVVWGFDDGKEVFHVHSDSERALAMSYRAFIKKWEMADYMTIFIYPERSIPAWDKR